MAFVDTGYVYGARSIGRWIGREVRAGKLLHKRIPPGARFARTGRWTTNGTQCNRYPTEAERREQLWRQKIEKRKARAAKAKAIEHERQERARAERQERRERERARPQAPPPPPRPAPPYERVAHDDPRGIASGEVPASQDERVMPERIGADLERLYQSWRTPPDR
jgi:hypothetical protein